MEINIKSPDDGGKTYSTKMVAENSNFWAESVTVFPDRTNHNPVLAALKNTMSYHMGHLKMGQNVVFLGKESQYSIVIGRKGNRYSINGITGTKNNLAFALARVVYKSCFVSDGAILAKNMWNHLNVSESISYALENRAPFHYYKEGKRIDVRLNLRLISSDECALELSDGVWANIPIKQMETFMSFYWEGKKRGSWKFLSPKNLWLKLFETPPTESQLQVMLAFLEQNRTSDIIEDRAKQLMLDLEKQYPDRIKITKKGENMTMYVRGRLADWVLTDAEMKTNIQAVSTFVYAGEEIGMRGPICIDNMAKDSSLGDQFATRALALLNDVFTVKIVNTIKHHLTSKNVDGQKELRLDWDNLEYWGSN